MWLQSLGQEDALEGEHGNPLQHSRLETPHGQRSLATGLQFIGLQTVRHDWSNLACTHREGEGERRLIWRTGEQTGLGSSVTAAVRKWEGKAPTNRMLSLLFSWWVMSNSFVTLWTTAHQAPLSMEFSHQEYWRGLPLHPPVDLPNPEMEPMSPPLADGFFTIKPQGKPTNRIQYTESSKFK